MSSGPLFGCPGPVSGPHDVVTLAHGEGARTARQFIQKRILPKFHNSFLSPLNDASCLTVDANRIVVTTDSFVVSPRFFPGGNIGTLAVYGTVNDLVVSGARPRWLTLSLMIEEGFSFAELDDILTSIATAAHETDVCVVTGDTKVVPRRAVDGLFLNTTGIGELILPAPSGPESLQVGDKLIVTGPVGQHGVTIMSIREGFDFSPTPTSDCGSLLAATNQLRNANVSVRCMRDATRGGVAAVLQEWAESSALTLLIDEQSLPVSEEVRGACELLGLDPIHLACEGTMLLAVPTDQSQVAIEALQTTTAGRLATEIGEVRAKTSSPVNVLRAGREMPLDEPSGPPLPRIC